MSPCLAIFYVIGALMKMTTNHDNSWISRGVPVLVGVLALVAQHVLQCPAEQIAQNQTAMLTGYATPDRKAT